MLNNRKKYKLLYLVHRAAMNWKEFPKETMTAHG